MSLRMRLFLRIGTLFFVILIASVFFESKMAGKYLREAESNLRQKLLYQEEQKRERIEKFLAIALSEGLANVNALLQRVAEYQILRDSFLPSSQNIETGTWVNAATLILTNDWIDFLQNTNDGKLSSLIMPDPSAMKNTQRVPVDKGLAWVTINQMEMPLLGVQIFANPEISDGAQDVVETSPEIYLLFDYQTLLHFDKSDFQTAMLSTQTPFLSPRHFKSALDQFLASCERAQLYLQKGPPQNMNGWIKQEISAMLQKNPHEIVPCKMPTVDHLNERLAQMSTKDDEDLIIWDLLGVIHPFDKYSPQGAGIFIKDAREGEGVLSKDIFQNEPLFEDAAYFQAHLPKEACFEIADSSTLVQDKEKRRIFVANTLKLTDKEKNGYLTIGVNAENVLQELAVATHEKALLVHGGKVVGTFAPDGKSFDYSSLDIEKMLSKSSGTITWDGASYFFSHMIPFKNADLHYFTLNLEADEFAVIEDLDEGSKQVISKISTGMRIGAIGGLIIALLLLSNIARLITKPISLLAAAAQKVGSGQLEKVDLPPLKKKRKDEVATLYLAFEEMVKGLKEKEKVKGVLNKVVSQDIAEEILKGAVHLGGEEKVVTMLFADIRNFTHITEHMSPKETIDMLNTCMTRISVLIDEYGGVIDKYVGDEVMALFGAPLEKEDSPLKAVLCAMAMVESLKSWNAERASLGLVPIEMGIGIHTGKVLAGNMGAENRLNYTVLGANVNLASRLCSAAKGMQIIISQATLDALHVKEKVVVEELTPMSLKGFEGAIAVYEVKGVK